MKQPLPAICMQFAILFPDKLLPYDEFIVSISLNQLSYCINLCLWIVGATEAARGAADIVLTEPGLSTIVTAIIGARKIFQRMNTYAKYTVAMTFRICLTFGILTTVYNW